LELIRDSRHRIRSMALIHEQLYRHEDLSDVGLGPYLESIAGHLFRSFGVEPGRVALRCRLDEISIDLDRAVSCGLIANELLSNCLEHAFRDADRGEIHLTIRHRPGGLVQLSIADDGRGFEVDADRSQSMGLDLVDMMAQQLRGRLHLESDSSGSRFSIEFPADPTRDLAAEGEPNEDAS
ncbi:MAG: histidine kinase dimerization/phosphoacceptor domain -containing protein, partial [Acidobacteriota bacterium]